MNSSRHERSAQRTGVGAQADRFDAAFRLLEATLAAAPPKDLTHQELRVLDHVADGEGATLGWLAEHLAMPKSSASVLVKDLERRRFVRRRRRDDDERRLEVRLTPKGRRRVVAARALDASGLERALRRLPRAERAAVVRGVEHLAEEARRARRSGTGGRPASRA